MMLCFGKAKPMASVGISLDGLFEGKVCPYWIFILKVKADSTVGCTL